MNDNDRREIGRICNRLGMVRVFLSDVAGFIERNHGYKCDYHILLRGQISTLFDIIDDLRNYMKDEKEGE